MEEVKKVSPLKGRKLGPRKGPSPLKGRKLGPRKPKPLVVPLGVLEAVQKSKRAQIVEAIKPGIDALFDMEYKKTVQEPSVNTLLQERALQYGTFAALAKTAQEFKSVLYRELGSRNKRLADDQAEALDMILTKIARIINGNADIADHYFDIAGYATLVAERLQGRSR
jgi:predicted ATPase